ncbi:hypothetical protein [Nostoc sp. ChiQUE01b]|uniref:hypothetical protein n=1 Tax=Nostoc sp. ChiQUE01b TaxID=3075376 RepID=UPI002AD4792A|nr:hypothetical protein [Nostoc sp. ChiQUE01b]MDZ8260742.1 hypothetical protein [Nostoc sp. ChiQUE01b]
MVQFTPRYINFLKSNLSIGEGTSPQDEGDSLLDSDYLFQILIFEENSEHPKLIYGTKKNLLDMLDPPKSSDSTLFPSKGTSIDKDFMSDIPGELGDAQRSTVRFLKQARELSQRMAATWLNEEKIPTDEDKIKIKLVRKILNSYNLPLDTYFVNDEGTLNNNPDGLEQLIMTAQAEGNQDLYLIKREYVSYNSISLSLLLCGQAYYKNDNNEWTRIWEPIFSNYEIVYEYALDLSWDTYYATRKDIAQPGINQNPPYTEVTLGYPPRPPEFNLTQEDIQRWVRAKEMPLTGEENSEFPFYPPKENGKFVSDQIRFVAPPFPYLPLSTV